MFAATLVFCLHVAGTAPQCGILTDTLGPHKTETACRDRSAEMKSHLNRTLRARGFPGTVQTRVICRKFVKGTRI